MITEIEHLQLNIMCEGIWHTNCQTHSPSRDLELGTRTDVTPCFRGMWGWAPKLCCLFITIRAV